MRDEISDLYTAKKGSDVIGSSRTFVGSGGWQMDIYAYIVAYS